MLYLGNKIRELRKSRGITQEQLASSPQAVSKWEMCTGYPDISMLPIIAGYFRVSLDVLFDYDAKKVSQRIDEIKEEASRFFWSDFERAKKTLIDGIEKFPGSDELKSKLLSLYTCHINNNDRPELVNDAIELAETLITESNDYFIVSGAKADMATLSLIRNDYSGAKRIIESMPTFWPLNINDKMRCSAYLLKGEDRLKSASDWKPYAHQDMFVCCDLEGRGYFEIGEYEKAIASFTQSILTIEMFLKDGKVAPRAYPIPGTESNHCASTVSVAACHHKLGQFDDCEKALEKAYEIAIKSHTPELLENDRDYCLLAYRTAYHEFGLDEYKPCQK